MNPQGFIFIIVLFCFFVGVPPYRTKVVFFMQIEVHILYKLKILVIFAVIRGALRYRKIP